MKRLFTFIFLLLPVIAYAFTGEVVIDGINYFIVTKGQTAEVRAGNYSGDIVIPATVEYDNVTCNVTAIGDWAFNGCKNLESISIGENVTTIGSYSFNGCSKLTSINWPSSLTEIGFCAFTYCTALPSITVPSSVVSIKDYAFVGCSGITTVEMSDNVNYIGDFAFQDCIRLKTVSLSNSLSSISRDVFNGCISLESIVLPNNVASIGYRSFYGCKKLQSIKLGNNVTQIGESAFNGCISLSSITIPKSMVSIGISAFEGCANLSYVAIPDGVTSISRNTFYGCSSLKQVIIGSSIAFISDKAFAQCSDITDVYCYSESVPNTNWDVFENSYIEYANLHVPESSIEAYSTAQPWKNFKKIVKVMPMHTLSYIVDGDIYKSYQVEEDATITIETEPTKEGYTFSGWSEIPETMPAHDVTVVGSFSINSYKLTYSIDGEEYKSYEVEYGTSITVESEPTKEGYTFSGWSEIPGTMPAHDVTVMGSFSINSYKLTYTVDGEDYKSYEVKYGTSITAENEPTKEGYTFSGWSEIPETMPAHDVTVTGSFSINSYTLTYMIENEVYKTVKYEYGANITPEPQPEGDYATFEWTDLPSTMPAHDVTVYATYTSGIDSIILTQGYVRIYGHDGKPRKELQKGLNIVKMRDGTKKKVVVR